MVELALDRGPAKLIYLMPTFQNPTSRTMSTVRRAAIAAIADRRDVLLVEDDVYYDLRFSGEHLPALRSFAPERTVYLSSLSKIFAPAARIGFSVMPPTLLENVLILKQGIDMQTSAPSQAIAAEFLRGEYQTNISDLARAYATKHAILQRSLREHMPRAFSWNQPAGGMFAWLTGPEAWAADGACLERGIERGVGFLPGSSFFAQAGYPFG